MHLTFDQSKLPRGLEHRYYHRQSSLLIQFVELKRCSAAHASLWISDIRVNTYSRLLWNAKDMDAVISLQLLSVFTCCSHYETLSMKVVELQSKYYLFMKFWLEISVIILQCIGLTALPIVKAQGGSRTTKKTTRLHTQWTNGLGLTAGDVHSIADTRYTGYIAQYTIAYMG